jgi:DNA-binding transcriptional LysR family regulator
MACHQENFESIYCPSSYKINIDTLNPVYLPRAGPRRMGLLGVTPKRAALVDQEASMLDLVRSGVGLSLVRDSIAMHEAQSRGLVIADKVSLGCTLCFVYPAARSHELVIGAALQALDKVWG